MRFNPIYFINLCEQAGFTMTRKDNLICCSYNSNQVAGRAFFIQAIRKHKGELLPLLAEYRDAIQLDLFDGDNPTP